MAIFYVLASLLSEGIVDVGGGFLSDGFLGLGAALSELRTLALLTAAERSYIRLTQCAMQLGYLMHFFVRQVVSTIGSR